MGRKRPHHGSRRRGNHPKPHRQRMLLEGTLSVLRPGLAQVHTAEGTFLVARRGVREAMHGDTVQVSLVPMHGRKKEPVAYVQAVLERANNALVGTYEYVDPLGVVAPLDTRMAHDFFVVPSDSSARDLGVQNGDVVRATIVEYPTRQSAGVVTIEKRLGSAEELDVSIEAVIASHGIATEFPPDALREAETICVDAQDALREDALRRDLRDSLCVTVDPVDARDFDDAVGAEGLPDGGYRVWVHIADVTHYVQWSSSIDLEAQRRTCSVYLADRVVPMLPERLCNNVCSLRPHEDRLAVTVCMELDAGGRVVSAEAYPSVICSSGRLSYDEVDGLLDGTRASSDLTCELQDAPKIARMLELLDAVATLRQRIRHERGAIDFSSMEAKVVLDDAGKPTGVVVRRRTRATALVEEAMLLANESVAKMLADRDVSTAYRVHERPSSEDLMDCAPALQELGLLDGALAGRLEAAEPHALQEILEAARGTSAEHLVNTLLLRAQKRAVYLPHNDGHYALGAPAYCHFTSPIRRYPDMLVHRALMWQLRGTADKRVRAQTQKALPQLCATCSERERVADAAERASVRIKMAELYASHVGESYSGVVVGCERFGLFVMLDETCAEGILPVRALGDEWFVHDEARLRLVGESTGRAWRVGQRVAVRVAELDVPRGRIEFVLA